MKDFLLIPLAYRLIHFLRIKGGTTHEVPHCKQPNYSSRWGGQPWKIAGSTFGRYHESPENVFRLAGKFHDLNSRTAKHKGWYVDDIHAGGTETTHGLVFRLTRGRGFLVACSDPYNDGPAIFEVHENGQPVIYPCGDDEDTHDAAQAADRFAEIYAESCREDNEKQREEMRKEDEREQAEEIKSAFSAE